MTEPSTDVLRKAVHARIRTPHALTLLAREIEGIGTHTLENFAAGKVDLQVETMQALAKLIFPMAEFDAERNLLRPANKQEAKGYVLPPRFDATTSLYYFPVTTEPQIGPQPVNPEPARPKATTRPGWARWGS
jgi:hypothetical protein